MSIIGDLYFKKFITKKINDLKFGPMIDQTGTMTGNAAKFVSDHLRPLCKNKYTINDTLPFADIIKTFTTITS